MIMTHVHALTHVGYTPVGRRQKDGADESCCRPATGPAASPRVLRCCDWQRAGNAWCWWWCDGSRLVSERVRLAAAVAVAAAIGTRSINCHRDEPGFDSRATTRRGSIPLCMRLLPCAGVCSPPSQRTSSTARGAWRSFASAGKDCAHAPRSVEWTKKAPRRPGIRCRVLFSPMRNCVTPSNMETNRAVSTSATTLNARPTASGALSAEAAAAASSLERLSRDSACSERTRCRVSSVACRAHDKRVSSRARQGSLLLLSRAIFEWPCMRRARSTQLPHAAAGVQCMFVVVASSVGTRWRRRAAV